MKPLTKAELMAMEDEVKTWPTWQLVKVCLWGEANLSLPSRSDVAAWFIRHHWWGGPEQMMAIVEKIQNRQLPWNDFCRTYWSECPEKGKRLPLATRREMESWIVCMALTKEIPMASNSTPSPAPKKEKPKLEQLADDLYEKIEQVGDRADNARLALEVWMDTAGVWLRPDDPQPTEENKREAQQDWKKFQSSLDALQRSVQEVLKHRHLTEVEDRPKEEPHFVILSLVDLKESMRHTVSNSDLPKYLSAAMKWQRGAPNRAVLVQSVKSGVVMTAEAALAKIQSKKGGNK